MRNMRITKNQVLAKVKKFFSPDIALYVKDGVVKSFHVSSFRGLKEAGRMLELVGKTVDEIQHAIPDICWEIIDYENQETASK
jgi:hypothetical protein